MSCTSRTWLLVYLDPGIDTCSGFALLAVCNRLTRPGSLAGYSHGNLLCFYFCTVPAVLGNGQIFVLYRQKWQCNVKNKPYGAMIYQMAIPAVWRF